MLLTVYSVTFGGENCCTKRVHLMHAVGVSLFLSWLS